VNVASFIEVMVALLGLECNAHREQTPSGELVAPRFSARARCAERSRRAAL